MSTPSRAAEIRRRRSRKAKLTKLRTQFTKATSDRDRDAVVGKAAKRGYGERDLRRERS